MGVLGFGVLQHPIAAEIPEYPRRSPWDLPKGCWLCVHAEGGKSGDDNSQISVQGWKGAWFEKYFGMESLKSGMRACSRLLEVVEFCFQREKRFPKPQQSFGGGERAKLRKE